MTSDERDEMNRHLKDVGEVVTDQDPATAELYKQLKEIADRTRQ